MLRRALAACVLVLALAACGGAQDAGGGSASLWVTRDRGAEVLLTATVPAGLTVLQALDREADVETRYGGRFVQAINGVAGSLAEQRDWFYFVNGIEPDVGAAEVELAPGDVAWWDYRSWEREMEAPVVVGAFPKPFTRGWTGAVRPVEVRAPPELADEARALETLLQPRGTPPPGTEPNVFVLEVRPGTEGATLTATRGPANTSPVTFVLAGSEAAVRAAAAALARDPAIVRYRYTARFDAAGNVVG
jgi:hypothetical protein